MSDKSGLLDKARPDHRIWRFVIFAAATSVIVLGTATVTFAQERETPEYLRQARIALFMANETVKFCSEIEEDKASVSAFLADLNNRLTEDGITDVKTQLRPMSLSEIVDMASQIMAENGGPFQFSEEKYCAYGRREIERGSSVGRLLKISEQ